MPARIGLGDQGLAHGRVLDQRQHRIGLVQRFAGEIEPGGQRTQQAARTDDDGHMRRLQRIAQTGDGSRFQRAEPEAAAERPSWRDHTL